MPPERTFFPQFLEPSPNSAQVTISKIGGGIFDKSCSGRLLVENKPIAEMHAWEQVVLHLERGQYSIVFVPGGICQGKRAAVEIQVRADETRNFQIHNGSNGDFAIVESKR